MALPDPPKVFISYSWDSLSHKDRVLMLADQLRKEGIDCDLDQYETSPPEGWLQWMTRRLEWSDFVLVICTETYRRRVDGHEPVGVGRGVKWEGAIISQVIYQSDSLNTKFVPVAFSQGDRNHVPIFLGGASFYVLDDDYERLYRHLTNQPPTPKPELGKLRPLPPKPRRTDTIQASTTPDQHNPYDPWTPAIPPRFHGRKSLLQTLARALDDRRSVSLIGDWRIGKSSLLATWAGQVGKTGRAVRMLSGEGPEGSSIGAFTAALTGQPAPDEPDQAANAVDGWLSDVDSGGLPPLVLVDECDGLFARFEHRFFERLRGMLECICLVLASRREIDEVCQEIGKTSPFLNRLELRRVGLMVENESEAIIEMSDDQLSLDDKHLMRRLAGTHPFYLQLLGRRLLEARLEGQDREEALDQFHDEASARLREWWRSLRPGEQKTLCDIRLGKPVSKAKQRALRSRGLITREGELFGEVLRDWL